MYKYLIKISRKIFKDKGPFNIDIKEQEKIFNEVKRLIKNNSKISDVERSYYQYLCQMKLNSNLKNLFINLISLFLIFPTMIYFLFKSPKSNKNCSKNIGINLGVQNKLPESLKYEYNIVNGRKSLCLNLKDINFIFSNLIVKYPLSFHFVFKNILKISLYRFNIKLYPHANSILVSSEYSFTSSCMTKYCNDMGLKHINYMHGEKLFYIRDSFVKFDRFYIWDKYYRKLFLDLNAFEKQFIVELPDIFIRKYVNNNFKDSELDRLTYYLQGFESDDELNCIKNFLNKFNDLETKVRPHPIYSDKKIIDKYFKKDQIENNKDIDQSLKEAKYIVSKYSTVLFEGYLMKKNIVIDDISSPNFYKNLKRTKYIIFNKKPLFLSEML
jgi:hypothetical protein